MRIFWQPRIFGNIGIVIRRIAIIAVIITTVIFTITATSITTVLSPPASPPSLQSFIVIIAITIYINITVITFPIMSSACHKISTLAFSDHHHVCHSAIIFTIVQSSLPFANNGRDRHGALKRGKEHQRYHRQCRHHHHQKQHIARHNGIKTKHKTRSVSSLLS